MFRSKRELSAQKCAKVKNPCKICLEAVTEKNGLRCQGACKKWAHFKCLNYTPGKIQDIKTGYIKVSCPCPNCDGNTKETQLKDAPKYCGKSHCPARNKPECEVPTCPVKGHPLKSCPEDCPPIPRSRPQPASPPEPKIPDCCKHRSRPIKSPHRIKSPPRYPMTPPPCPTSPTRKKSPPRRPVAPPPGPQTPPRRKSPPRRPITPPSCPQTPPRRKLPPKVDQKLSPCCSPNTCTMPISSPLGMSPVENRSAETLTSENPSLAKTQKQLASMKNELCDEETVESEDEKESKLRQFFRYCSHKACRTSSPLQTPQRKYSESVLITTADEAPSQSPPPYSSNPDITSPKRRDSVSRSRHKQVQYPSPVCCPSHLSVEENMNRDQPCYEFGQNMPSNSSNDKHVGLMKIQTSTDAISKCSAVAPIPTRPKAEIVSSFPSIGKYYGIESNGENGICGVMKPSKSDSHLKCSDPRKMLLHAVERMYDTMGQFHNQFRDLMSKMLTTMEKCS